FVKSSPSGQRYEALAREIDNTARLAGTLRLFYLGHDHDELPQPCDRGDPDARCSLYVSNARLLRAPA
ncbi:hypothetical protein AB0K87_32345, partial [Streptomyces sp. NPDC053705]|uniref:hypothetical protein n=1 Tax=Streptomyces sp. NPDC053705 TaxID=3156668 RepID=UPI00341D2A55